MIDPRHFLSTFHSPCPIPLPGCCPDERCIVHVTEGCAVDCAYLPTHCADRYLKAGNPLQAALPQSLSLFNLCDIHPPLSIQDSMSQEFLQNEIAACKSVVVHCPSQWASQSARSRDLHLITGFPPLKLGPCSMPSAIASSRPTSSSCSGSRWWFPVNKMWHWTRYVSGLVPASSTCWRC